MTNAEINERVAVEVMGWTWGRTPDPEGDLDCWRVPREDDPTRLAELGRDFNPAESIADAWSVVEEVQRRNPGWRFDLIGGDKSMGYRTGPDGSWDHDENGDLIVVEDSACPFGWRASFFGEADPRKNYGQRHADEHAGTPAMAICLAALAALESKEKPHAAE